MLAPVLMDVVKVLLWLLLQQVYVMKGLGGACVLSCIMQSDVNKTELYSEGEKDTQTGTERERNLERLCDRIDESPTEAWHREKSSLFYCTSLF